MTTNLFIAITIVLLTTLIGLMSYWLKIVYKEIKQMLKELTSYINELKQLVVSMQTQIERGIEVDIEKLKSDVQILYDHTNKLQNKLSELNPKGRAEK
ncbi:MAG: hypothetical protein JKY52_05530 [Flavobacteriales bacterium]|nr:hypothetical protein [Flavobacteriales bacterium]